MLDLLNGLYALVAAVVGGVVTGLFMIWQQRAEFRHRANEAMRALLVELGDNRAMILDMQRRSQVDTLVSPSPSRLKSQVWESQLPLIVGYLKEDKALGTAYRHTDHLRATLPVTPDGKYFVVRPEDNNAIIAARELLDAAIATIRQAANLPE